MTSTHLAYLSNYCVYSAMVLFTIAFISHAVEVSFSVRNVDVKTQFDFSRTKKSGRLGSAMMILGFAFLFVGVIFRGASAHRVPWGNMYEFSITGALAFTGAYLVALRKHDLRWLGLFISISVLLTLGTAITLLLSLIHI